MARHIQIDQPRWLRKGGSSFLAFFWILGLTGGIWIYYAAESYPFFLMRGSFSGSVSIVGLLSLIALPFLLSILMVLASKPALILLICFCKAFLFSYISFGIVQYCGSSGWLVRALLLFYDCLAMPVLYLFWLRGMSDARRFCSLEAVFLLVLCFLLGSIDYSIISPFLAHVIDF